MWKDFLNRNSKKSLVVCLMIHSWSPRSWKSLHPFLSAGKRILEYLCQLDRFHFDSAFLIIPFNITNFLNSKSKFGPNFNLSWSSWNIYNLFAERLRTGAVLFDLLLPSLGFPWAIMVLSVLVPFDVLSDQEIQMSTHRQATFNISST